MAFSFALLAALPPCRACPPRSRCSRWCVC